MLLARSDPGIAGGPPTGLLGLIAVVGGIAIVVGLGWLLQRLEGRGRHPTPDPPPPVRRPANPARVNPTPAPHGSQVQIPTAAASAPEPVQQLELPSAPAQRPPQVELLAAEKNLSDQVAVRALEFREAALNVLRYLVAFQKECDAVTNWIRERGVREELVSSHLAGRQHDEAACTECMAKTLELRFLKIGDLYPNEESEPLWFDSEETWDALLEEMAEDERSTWAIEEEWRQGILNNLGPIQHLARLEADRLKDFLRKTAGFPDPDPEFLQSQPPHDHRGLESYRADDWHMMRCPACAWGNRRGPRIIESALPPEAAQSLRILVAGCR